MKSYQCFITQHLPIIEVDAENELIARMLIMKEIPNAIKASDYSNLDFRIKEKGTSFIKKILEVIF